MSKPLHDASFTSGDDIRLIFRIDPVTPDDDLTGTQVELTVEREDGSDLIVLSTQDQSITKTEDTPGSIVANAKIPYQLTEGLTRDTLFRYRCRLILSNGDRVSPMGSRGSFLVCAAG